MNGTIRDIEESGVKEVGQKRGSRRIRRFNLDLSPEAYKDMEELGRMCGGITKREVFRVALSLLKLVYPAILRGEELCLVNREKKTERALQILIPGS